MDGDQSAERRAWLLRGLLLSQVWLAVQGRVVGYTWLVDSGGSSLLAWVYIGQALVIAVVSLALFALVDRVGRASLLAAMFGVYALGVGLAAAAPASQGASLAPFFLL